MEISLPKRYRVSLLSLGSLKIKQSVSWKFKGPPPMPPKGYQPSVSLHNPLVTSNNALFSLGLGIMWHWGGCPQIRMNSVAGTNKKNKSLGDLLSATFWVHKNRWRIRLGVGEFGFGCQHRITWGKKSGKLTSWGLGVCVSNSFRRLFSAIPGSAENLNHQTFCK